jgi:hypothetical protein
VAASTNERLVEEAEHARVEGALLLATLDTIATLTDPTRAGRDPAAHLADIDRAAQIATTPRLFAAHAARTIALFSTLGHVHTTCGRATGRERGVVARLMAELSPDEMLMLAVATDRYANRTNGRHGALKPRAVPPDIDEELSMHAACRLCALIREVRGQTALDGAEGASRARRAPVASTTMAHASTAAGAASTASTSPLTKTGPLLLARSGPGTHHAIAPPIVIPFARAPARPARRRRCWYACARMTSEPIPPEYAGWWRITETGTWVNDGLDILGPALISFTGHGGRLRMHCLLAYVDARFVRGGVSFTWEGAWEYDPKSGTGRVRLGKDGRLKGTIKIKDGDDSTFVAERTEEPAEPIEEPPSYRDKWRRRW